MAMKSKAAKYPMGGKVSFSKKGGMKGMKEGSAAEEASESKAEARREDKTPRSKGGSKKGLKGLPKHQTYEQDEAEESGGM